MADPIIMNSPYSLTNGVCMLIEAVMAPMLAMVQIMALYGLLTVTKIYRNLFHIRHMIAMRTVLWFQGHMVLALPGFPEDNSMNIAMKSYNLNRTSFIVMATMGGIMTVIGLIQLAMTVVKLYQGQQNRDNSIPRNPANSEAEAEAQKELGQPTTDDPLTNHFEEELSPMAFEFIGSAGSVETDSGKTECTPPCPEIKPMPHLRLPRG